MGSLVEGHDARVDVRNQDLVRGFDRACGHCDCRRELSVISHPLSLPGSTSGTVVMEPSLVSVQPL